MKKIVICGGHLTPALALIDELQKNKNVELFFFGRKFSTEGSKNLSAEFKNIKKLNIKFYSITAGRLQRRFTKYTIWSLLKIPVGFIQSFVYLISVRPTLVVSFGGYLSLPAVFSAWLLGIKSITHEQSLVLGLANRLNYIMCDKTYLSWQQTAKDLAGKNYQVIGNLTRNAIFNKSAKDTKIQNFLITDKKLIFVMGGNQGSHFLNGLTFESLQKLSKHQIVHQVGTINYKGDIDRAREIQQENYLAVDYLCEDNFGAVVNKADLIISRSGANTVWDLAILAKVAILVPLPHSAGGEQEANAKILEDAGSATILSQANFNKDSFIKKIEDVLNKLPEFQKNAEKFAKTLPKNASNILAEDISELTN